MHLNHFNRDLQEYVACQTSNDPGVLILSSMAGAANTMAEALIVNPNHEAQVSDAILRGGGEYLSRRVDLLYSCSALQMPRDERAARMIALRGRER